jgi:transcriptional regulator with XRE-family HTH domain
LAGGHGVEVAGELLRDVREDLLLSQRAAAHKAGVTLSTLQKAEGGGPTSRISLRKIARALDRDFREFIANGEGIAERTTMVIELSDEGFASVTSVAPEKLEEEIAEQARLYKRVLQNGKKAELDMHRGTFAAVLAAQALEQGGGFDVIQRAITRALTLME